MLHGLFRRPPAAPSAYELALERGRSEIGIKNGFLRDTFGLGAGGTWGADLNAGTIRFDLPEEVVLTAPVQVIGTKNLDDGTWLWGWDHPSVPEPLARHAQAVHRFGIEHGIDRLTTRKIEATEQDAWDFVGLAVHLAGAQGGYRGPAGSTLVMMTFGGVTARRA